MSAPTNIVLSGVAGSTAYGLDHADSDVDRLGVFVAPTLDVAGLGWHSSRESHVTTDPDVSLHEVGKAMRLWLSCNPTITELLWLPEHEVRTPIGAALVGIRDAFLSTKAVHDAYGGYARQQATKLRNRGDGKFSANTGNRLHKHGRHLLRLLRQGSDLLTTGTLTVRVADPEPYLAVNRMDVPQMLAMFDREDAAFRDAAARSVLPERPDRDGAANALRRIRRNDVLSSVVAG